MRHALYATAAALAVTFTAGVSVAQAQVEVVAHVPFAFKAGATTHPAGEYTFRTDDDAMTVQITPQKGSANVVLAETRLAAPETALSNGRLVFDKAGDTYYLSEFWTPGDEGFLLHVTKAKHSHVTVKPQKRT